MFFCSKFNTGLPWLTSNFFKVTLNPLQHSPEDNLVNTWRNKRLKSELKGLLTDPPEGIRACPLDNSLSYWQASIKGPPECPYEGGLFFLHLEIPKSYPMRPPIPKFITRIFHPNISYHGDIGMDMLRHNWSLALTIPKVLVSIQSLLTDPYCEISMEPEIAQLCDSDREKFDMIAMEWTVKYAQLHRTCWLTKINVQSLKLANCLLVKSRVNTILVIIFVKVFVIPLEFKGTIW